MKTLSIIVCGIVLAAGPFLTGDRYFMHVASLIASYWILIAGLNLLVGYVGQLSIGHVGILSIGAYAYVILVNRGIAPPEVALLASGLVGAVCGLALGLPSLRLPSFYFTMATLAFAIVVTELTIAQADLTGGGAGLTVPKFSGMLSSHTGAYWLTAALAIAATLLTWNIARFTWGLALISVRDSEVTATSVGVSIYRIKLLVFTFSGFLAGIAGPVFASAQTYITPSTFAFDLGILFFICIIVGGQNSILGPFIGTVFLTALPDAVAPLAKYGGIIYGIVLLVCVLLIPRGIAELITRMIKPKQVRDRAVLIEPEYGLLKTVLEGQRRDVGH